MRGVIHSAMRKSWTFFGSKSGSCRVHGHANNTRRESWVGWIIQTHELHIHIDSSLEWRDLRSNLFIWIANSSNQITCFEHKESQKIAGSSVWSKFAKIYMYERRSATLAVWLEFLLLCFVNVVSAARFAFILHLAAFFLYNSLALHFLPLVKINDDNYNCSI